jgi:hypothetical protein
MDVVDERPATRSGDVRRLAWAWLQGARERARRGAAEGAKLRPPPKMRAPLRGYLAGHPGLRPMHHLRLACCCRRKRQQPGQQLRRSGTAGRMARTAAGQGKMWKMRRGGQQTAGPPSFPCVPKPYPSSQLSTVLSILKG